jgi:hypothetical protein
MTTADELQGIRERVSGECSATPATDCIEDRLGGQTT